MLGAAISRDCLGIPADPDNGEVTAEHDVVIGGEDFVDIGRIVLARDGENHPLTQAPRPAELRGAARWSGPVECPADPPHRTPFYTYCGGRGRGPVPREGAENFTYSGQLWETD
jgi:hypothetical protein